MNNLKYKYVVSKPINGDIYDFCYSDLENIENVDLLRGHIQFKTNFGFRLHRRHFKDGSKIPFKGIWARKYYKTKFNKKCWLNVTNKL